MRTKLSLVVAGVMTVGAAPLCQADLALGAPGVTAGSKVATKVPFKVDGSLTGSYKFVFGGIEAKSNTAGAPGNSGTNGNGGQFHISATVSATSLGKTKEGNIEFRDIQEFQACPLKQSLITPAEVFRATTTPITISLEWKGNGNAKKPDGIFNIIGEYQKAPPVPTGSLNFAVGDWMLQTTGGSQNPDGLVKIARE